MGWQRLHGASVQGALEDAVEKLTGVRADVSAQGAPIPACTRYAQVAHVDIDKACCKAGIVEALNAHWCGRIRFRC